MKFNLLKSKLMPAALKMPPLSHNTFKDSGVWKRDSDVLRWLAAQEDLQMWLFSICRAGGLIVKNDDGTYQGDPNWSGRNKKWEKAFRSYRHLNGAKPGRKVVHVLEGVVNLLGEDELWTKDWLERSKHEMSRSTFHRLIAKAKEVGLVARHNGGKWKRVKPETSSSTEQPQTTTACHCPEPLS